MRVEGLSCLPHPGKLDQASELEVGGLGSACRTSWVSAGSPSPAPQVAPLPPPPPCPFTAP